MFGELISRVAFLRKNDHDLYQQWIDNVEFIPLGEATSCGTYKLVVLLNSVKEGVLSQFLNSIQDQSWIHSVTIVLPQSKLIRVEAKARVTFMDFDTFKSEHLLHKNKLNNNIIIIHTLIIFESGWMPEIDMLLGSEVDLVISDQDTLGNTDCRSQIHRLNPFFKPGFSTELSYDPNYAPCLFLTNRLFCQVLSKTVANDQVAYLFLPDLMCAALTPTHLPRIVTHLLEKPLSWRDVSYLSTSNTRSIDLSTPLSHFPELYGQEDQVSISIIIPIKDNIKLLVDCVESINKHQYQAKYEILVLNNRSSDPRTLEWLKNAEEKFLIKCIECDFEFNWSKLCNVGIENTESDIIVLLNNDTLVITGDWLDRLAALANEENVGVVGPLLLYPDDSIQHAGVVLGFGGVADHIFMHEPIIKREPEIFISPLIRREVSACTGACQVFSRETYHEIGPFNERLRVTGDIEFCIRALRIGKRNLYDPSVSLYHLESKTRNKGLSSSEKLALKESVGELNVMDDNFFNSNLSRSSRSPLLNLTNPELAL